MKNSQRLLKSEPELCKLLLNAVKETHLLNSNDEKYEQKKSGTVNKF